MMKQMEAAPVRGVDWNAVARSWRASAYVVMALDAVLAAVVAYVVWGCGR